MNRLLGPDGEPIADAPRVASARITTRKTLEHEPRDFLIEVEVLIPSMPLAQKLIGRVNDLVCAMFGSVTVKAPVTKVRFFVDAAKFDQAISWANQLATVGGGSVARALVEEKEKPVEDPGAEPGAAPPTG